MSDSLLEQLAAGGAHHGSLSWIGSGEGLLDGFNPKMPSSAGSLQSLGAGTGVLGALVLLILGINKCKCFNDEKHSRTPGDGDKVIKIKHSFK